MKIAFIGQKGIPATVGGIETHVENLAVGLKKKGHDVFVYARPWYVEKKRKTYKGVKLIFKKSLHTKNFDAITHVFFSTLHAIKQDYDIIHYHGVGPALLAWIPKIFKPKAKVIVTFHCIDRKHMKWGMVARFFLWLGEWCAVKFSHETITVSKTLQKYCKDQYNADTIYIPNGIDKTKQVTASIIKKQYGLEPDQYILFLSRLVKHKGAHYLIDAYKKIKTDKKLVIAGGAAHTEKYEKELKKMAKGNDNIIFTGNVPTKSKLWYELYSNAYLFVLPSETEGLPTVILEAMAFGKCVLSSNIPENIEAIAGGFGFKFKNKDVFDLKKKLEYLLNNPKLAKKVGLAAQNHVYENYNWKEIVKAIEFVYDCALKFNGKQKVHHCVKSSIAKI